MGGSGGNNYDPLYNAGLLSLSEEEHEWAEEYVNFYKHGVTYDPNETGFVGNDGKFWTESELIETYGNHEWIRKVMDELPRTTRGEFKGYDFENTHSYMSMEQEQIAANKELLPLSTLAKKSQNIAETITSDTQMAQSLTDRALITGINPLTGGRVSPGNLEVGRAQQNRDLAMYEADERNVQYSEDAARDGYIASAAGSQTDILGTLTDRALITGFHPLTGGQVSPGAMKVGAAQQNLDLTRYQSDARVIPHSEEAAISGYNYETAKIKGQTPIMNQYFDKINKGVDVGGRVNQASADVASSWKGADQRTNMALEGMGVDPSSTRGRDAYSKSNMEYGRQMTTAKQTARKQAGEEDFNRMSTAISM